MEINLASWCIVSGHRIISNFRDTDLPESHIQYVQMWMEVSRERLGTKVNARGITVKDGGTREEEQVEFVEWFPREVHAGMCKNSGTKIIAAVL